MAKRRKSRRVSFWVSEPYFRRLQAICEEQRRPMSALLACAIEFWWHDGLGRQQVFPHRCAYRKLGESNQKGGTDGDACGNVE